MGVSSGTGSGQYQELKQGLGQHQHQHQHQHQQQQQAAATTNDERSLRCVRLRGSSTDGKKEIADLSAAAQPSNDASSSAALMSMPTMDSVSSMNRLGDSLLWDCSPTSPLSLKDLSSTVSSSYSPRLVVFSGGTAFNSVAGNLLRLTTLVTHVLPVSDDGGSTAEIVRVLGGPAVGDIRSRCLRLADDQDAEARAVRLLLGHRLPSDCELSAKQEWYSVVEGDHALWEGVSEPYKHTIRAFLVYFQSQILMNATQKFNFRNGSIGNFFFAGARLFFKSLEAAVFLFSRVARIPEGSLVLPAIQTEGRITLGAELNDGSTIRGQSEISHPSPSGPEKVDKICDGPVLQSAIRRVFYLSSEGTNNEHEVYLSANHRVLAEISGSNAIVYGMGSLFTSICSSLILDGVGEAVASQDVPKILILNGRHDRETSKCQSHEGPMTAVDVASAIVDALNRKTSNSQELDHPPSRYITTVLVPEGGQIPVDEKELQQKLGINTVLEVPSVRNDHGHVLFSPDALVDALDLVISDLG